MKVEEKLTDVAQNIELGIIVVYRADPTLLDCDVLDAVHALIRHYEAEEQGRLPSPPRLAERVQRVFDSAKSMCDWRLGRREFPGEITPETPAVHPKTLEEIIACLKRIHKSVRLWTSVAGRQGYLKFVDPYLL